MSEDTAHAVDPPLAYLAAPHQPEESLLPPRDQAAGRSGLRSALRNLIIHAFYNPRIVAAAVLLPILLGSTLAFYAGPRFTAESTLIVLLGRENTSQDIAGTNPISLSITGLKEVASEVDIIYSNDVIDQTLRAVGPATLLPGLAQRRWFGLLPPLSPDEQVKSAESWFLSHMRASVQNDTNILRVTFTDPDRGLAVRTLAALIDAYMAHRRAVFATTSSRFLTSQLDTYTKQLADIDTQIQQVKSQYDVLDIAQDIAQTESRLQRIQQRRDELAERRRAVAAQVEGAAARLASLPRTVFDSRDRSNQHGNDDSSNALLRLQVDRDHLAAQYTPSYPPLQELDRKIASTRAAIATAARTDSTASRDVRNPAFDVLNTQLVSSQVEEGALDRELQQVDAELGPAQQRAAVLRVAESRLRDLGRNRDVIEANYRQFSLREAGEQIEEDAQQSRNANVQIVQQPTAPATGGSLAPSFLLAGLLGGVLLGAAAIVLCTILRDAFILPEEVERHLGIPVLADLPVGPAQYGTPEGALQVANLAAMLLDVSAAGPRYSVFQFIPAEPESGNAGLVRAVAVEFASIHNMRTLIIDLQDDGQEHVAALGRGMGLPAGSADNRLQIQTTAIPHLSVAINAADSELASSRTLLPRSRQVLNSLRTRFDMVLAIAPARAGDYAARRLATLVDANLLVLRADHSRAATADQLCEGLLSAGAAIFGAIFVGDRAYVPRFVLRWL